MSKKNTQFGGADGGVGGGGGGVGSGCVYSQM
jgi:hypothetical protein